MSGVLMVLAATLLLCGCARLPELISLSNLEQAGTKGICHNPFPARPWRAVHAIYITGPFGHRSSVLGVTVVEPLSRRIRAVIMSVEGVVLFDVTYDDAMITVHRLLPPLDREGFSEGLLRDVSLMFLAPEGSLSRIGRDQGGHLVCRWQEDEQGTTDVYLSNDGASRILQYDRDNSLKREVRMKGSRREFLSEEVELVSHGLGSYTLYLELLEVEVLSEYEELFSR